MTIELDAIELQQKEIGERVWLIYEPLGIEFQTRVLSKTSRIPDIKSSVVIGNTVTRSLSDILTSTKIDIDVNKKQSQSSFEQTNEKFTLEVERVDDSIATLEIEADQIELSVIGIDDRLGTAEGALIVQSNNIALKVSETDYNGNTIASLINQTATVVDIQASKINLVGAVTFSNFDNSLQNTVNGKTDSSDVTTIVGNTVTTSYINALEITAQSLSTTAQIDVGTDVYVGKNIYLANYAASGERAIYLKGTTAISTQGGGDSLLVSAMGNLNLSAGFGDVQIDGERVATTGDLSNVVAKFG